MRAFRISILVLSLFITKSLYAKNLQLNFQYLSYQNQESQAYIETYISFLGTSIQYQEITPGAFQGTVLVNMIIRQGEEIYHADRYEFHTPVLDDTLNTAGFFIDKQIISLPLGEYKLYLEVADKAALNFKHETTIAIELDFPKDKVCFSGLLFLDSFSPTEELSVLSKSGYDLIPLSSQGDYFLDESTNELNIYVEWYNTAMDTSTSEGYLFNCYIENYQTHKPLNDFIRFKRKTHDSPQAYIGGFDISTLASGNYNLVVSLLDRQGKSIIQERTFFQRLNTKVQTKPEDFSTLNSNDSFVKDIVIIEEMAEYISTLLPIATIREWSFAENQLKTWNLEQMQQFFYGFWYNRNPISPEDEWAKYQKGVEKVNEMFSTLKVKGFATDRGQVFLKYGSANFIENSVHENYTLPYQIWQYNKLGKQSNRIFVFVETALGTNDYQLVHSTAIGELFNENWRSWIYRKRGIVTDLDGDNIGKEISLPKQ